MKRPWLLSILRYVVMHLKFLLPPGERVDTRWGRASPRVIKFDTMYFICVLLDLLCMYLIVPKIEMVRELDLLMGHKGFREGGIVEFVGGLMLDCGEDRRRLQRIDHWESACWMVHASVGKCVLIEIREILRCCGNPIDLSRTIYNKFSAGLCSLA